MKHDPYRFRHLRLEDLNYQVHTVDSAADGGVDWFEALVRWRPTDGIVRGPLDVLPCWLTPTRIEPVTRLTVAPAAEALRRHPDPGC